MCNECTLHIKGRLTFRLNIGNQYHCRTDPAYTISDIGSDSVYVLYKVNGTIHREDGPALEDHGNKAWYIDGIKFNATSQKEFEIEYREWKIRAFK